MDGVDRLNIRNVQDGSVLAVKAVPGSSRDKITGVLGNTLKISTSCPAEKGKANSALAQTLARALLLPKRRVSLVSGQTNPYKEFHIEGLSAEQVRAALEAL